MDAIVGHIHKLVCLSFYVLGHMCILHYLFALSSCGVKVQTMKSTDVMTLAIIPCLLHAARDTPPGAWRLLFSESLYPSAVDNLYIRVLYRVLCAESLY